MVYSLTFTEHQHAIIHSHLFQPDGCEAVAILLCGIRKGIRTRLMVHSVHPVPIEQCSSRSPTNVTWPADFLLPLIDIAEKRGLSIVKIHGHLDFRNFSAQDDLADTQLFPSLHGWFDSEIPLASAVMMHDGEVFGRTWDTTGDCAPIELVSMIGDDIRFWHQHVIEDIVPDHALRISQSFGAGTYALLRRMKVGVVGCSGTGSPVIEMLARNCVGEMVLVDPDHIEEKNLNRILNSTSMDAEEVALKVDVAKRTVESLGFGTKVHIFARNIFDRNVAVALADCDFIFGCVDSIDGRHFLNSLASYYSIPFIDMGVRIDADGVGGVDQVCGSVHYLQPGGSSLLSRNVYTSEQLRSAGLLRRNPEEYRRLLEQGYIRGVAEDRPAVIQLNMLIASLAVNELLARIHPYRIDPNCEFAVRRVSLSHNIWENEEDGEPCAALSKKVGRGDLEPLIEWAELSAGLESS